MANNKFYSKLSDGEVSDTQKTNQGDKVTTANEAQNETKTVLVIRQTRPWKNTTQLQRSSTRKPRSTVSTIPGHFMKLPVEIRQIILAHVFQNLIMVDITKTDSKSPQRTHGRQSVLFVNRQLREESLLLFYKTCIFYLNHYELHNKYRRQNAYKTRDVLGKLHISWKPPRSSLFEAVHAQPSFILDMQSLKDVTIDCIATNQMRVTWNETVRPGDLEMQILSKYTNAAPHQFPRWVRQVVMSDRSFDLFLILYFNTSQSRSPKVDEEERGLMAAKIHVDDVKVVALRYCTRRNWRNEWDDNKTHTSAYHWLGLEDLQNKWEDLYLVPEDSDPLD